MPRPAPHGPRKPLTRSRSPSPERLEELNDVTIRIDKLQIDQRSASVKEETSPEEYPIAKPSAKALGKRRMVENFDVEDRFDPDDLFKADDDKRSRSGSASGSDDDRSLRNLPAMYAYDALAEKSRAREMERRRTSEKK